MSSSGQVPVAPLPYLFMAIQAATQNAISRIKSATMLAADFKTVKQGLATADEGAGTYIE